MSRPHPCATILVAVTALLAGCVPGLAADPRFATNSGARPQGAAASKPAPGGPPPLAAPKNDLAWHDCTSRVFADAAVPPAPGIQLDCANYDADLDPVNGGGGALSVGVVRARSNQTPRDAGPLVFTTGSDLPSSAQLPVWLSRAGADVLAAHPIVAVDRRGIGMSSPIDCRDKFDRQQMRDQSQFQAGDDPVANLSEVANTATTNCTDAIAPGASAYDDAHAASDIERLRSTWDVPALALIGIGNGAQVALAYAGSRPDKVARLILDSPVALGVNAEAAAEQQVKGQQAALDAFAAQCIAVNCALGPDPKGAVSALLADARAGKGPGGVSVAQVANAITVALGFPSGGRVNATTDLANALASARSGDTNALNNLINHANAMQDSDGQFVNVCSDAVNRPTPDRVRELVVAWGKLYPQFGTVAALNMVKCVHWPTGSPPPSPKSLKVDVLLLGVQNDPIVGTDGVAATAAGIINANAASKRVMWQGIGHGASIYSGCAVPPLIGYLGSGKLPNTDTYCPA
ncbi:MULTISPECIES: alpha/beta hydrolase [Mycobacterium avium complex (MAC)]|nr:MULTISPECIES: alpha/beta hydrolase [Mycobacterium avium complex (MAC)]MBZ4534053.1 alpha/beta hydrolase [Mycobacterium avium subsp. hominissuis]MBZ4592821.1 alpha/beta hydrolase [Mycobacterium avium subsp. hominissuis]MBZ4634651.1 alpha/beta hydrolase [Mycobacterium avium subsp. hominissuis]MCV6990339.1 alpha/beta fold hydrolase [Mycobacterium bouchedurhonense]MCV6996198.1 alpha/beta fold hydrolase [Mycobacterium timonense]